MGRILAILSRNEGGGCGLGSRQHGRWRWVREVGGMGKLAHGSGRSATVRRETGRGRNRPSMRMEVGHVEVCGMRRLVGWSEASRARERARAGQRRGRGELTALWAGLEARVAYRVSGIRQVSI